MTKIGHAENARFDDGRARLNPTSGTRELVMLKWCSVPFWAKDEKFGYGVALIARSEINKEVFLNWFGAARYPVRQPASRSANKDRVLSKGSGLDFDQPVSFRCRLFWQSGGAERITKRCCKRRRTVDA